MATIFKQEEMENATVLYCESYFSQVEAKSIFDSLDQEIDWQIYKVKVANKIFDQPRQSCFISDSNIVMFYSGYERKSYDWTHTTSLLRKEAQHIANSIYQDLYGKDHPKINAVLCNKYPNGKSYIGAHSDSEKYSPESMIISFSFGAVRDFVFQSKSVPKLKNKKIQLSNGSVVVMGKGCQVNWKHTVPVRTKCDEPRINLTFRSIHENET